MGARDGGDAQRAGRLVPADHRGRRRNGVDRGAGAVVLDEVEAPVSAGNHHDLQPRRVDGGVELVGAGQRHDGALAQQHRYRSIVAVHLELAVALVHQAGEQVGPDAGRKPRPHRTAQGDRVAGPGDRGDDELRTEFELVGHRIGRRAFRLEVVHRPDQRNSVRGAAVVHRVQVGHEPVAPAQRLAHVVFGVRAVHPRLLDEEGVVRGVQPQNRREHAELHPPQRQLIVAGTEHVAADVVAPPPVAGVGGRGGELGLELQRRPGDHRVAGEAHRIPVTARSGVPGEGQRPPPVARGIEEVEMVQHPQRVDAVHPGVLALLPVDPPEIDAVVLQTPVQYGEVGLQEGRVGDVERDRLAVRRITAESRGHVGVGVLVRTHSVGRVDVEGDPVAALVQLGEEGLRIGEQCAVPAVAGPAAAVARVDVVHAMPVHVEHRDRERQPVGGEAVQQLQVVLGGVGVVAAPPVPQRPARQHRRLAGDGVERVERLLVVMTVGEHVQIQAAAVARGDPAVVVEEERPRIVQHGETARRHHAWLQRHRAVGHVQSAGGAAQIRRAHPVPPQ